MSTRKHEKEKTEKANAGDEEQSERCGLYTGSTPEETLPPPTFEDYQCSGNVELDCPELCTLLKIRTIPPVYIRRQPTVSVSETEGSNTEDSQSCVHPAEVWSMRCLQIELEDENPLNTKTMTISGWRVNEEIVRVLCKMLPSLSTLQSLQFWRTYLTDPLVKSLASTFSLCSNLKVLKLEANPLPEHSYHLLLSEESLLTHLSLRNNQIGDEGARLIGAALSTIKSANKNLLSLNLAFNHIGDAGASHIAQGLRLNRILLVLSLANNWIGDCGAARLAEVLGEFALTHTEVVQRRRMLLAKKEAQSLVADSGQSSGDQLSTEQLPSASSNNLQGNSRGESKASKKRERAKKRSVAKNKSRTKKSSDGKGHLSKDGKYEDTETENKQNQEAMEVHPLLDPSVQRREGQVILPGNCRLISLSLAGNKITKQPLPLFLSSLQSQTGERRLLRLCLQRNRFPPDCDTYEKIKKLMALRDPLKEVQGS